MKTVFASSLSLSDFVRADAGINEAVFDARLSILYTAIYHVFKGGNKTQFNMLTAACGQFKDIKECKSALDSARITPAVKRMHAVYLAYGAALDAVGPLALMKGASHEEMDKRAAALACEAATMVTVALTPEVKATKTEEEKAAAKAEKEAKIAAEQAEQASKLATTVEAAKEEGRASVPELSLTDMARIVANAVKQGMLSADALAELDSALDAVATNVELIPVHMGAAETLAA